MEGGGHSIKLMQSHKCQLPKECRERGGENEGGGGGKGREGERKSIGVQITLKSVRPVKGRFKILLCEP